MLTSSTIDEYTSNCNACR